MTGSCAGHCRSLGAISIGGAIPNCNLAFGLVNGNVVGLHERRSCQNISVEVLNY